MSFTDYSQVRVYYSDANETIYFSLRSRTFLGKRTIIGTAESNREELLKTSGAEIEGTQISKSLVNMVVHDSSVTVPLTVERSPPGGPQLSITISVKRIGPEENAELLFQSAETAIAATGIESQRDLGLELENGISDLRETLKTVVDVVIDKMDVLAEVRRSVHGLLRYFDIVLHDVHD